MPVFTKDAGRFLASEEVVPLKEAYQKRKAESGLAKDKVVQSEFFGIDQIQRLLSQPGCVGLRIHHAKRWEDENGRPTAPGKGDLKPRVLLTAVDSAGRDLPLRSANGGLKDSMGRTEALGDGPVCPRHCAEDDIQ
ncbi:hypothetical protein BN8_00309 [Fibrisoma limi BUZ 3]|uniref:Uncharacterized protein n=1 Tax=Fibrisoma limi BUZ 3 TaxID=1185876 RepID=I2GBW5_9BACT|nr:hypothetical protein [Fibrisoma limi]CCH51389.1 hypothetical protein BN8_00309 [Fibrisoma limi BUZ 3]